MKTLTIIFFLTISFILSFSENRKELDSIIGIRDTIIGKYHYQMDTNPEDSAKIIEILSEIIAFDNHTLLKYTIKYDSTIEAGIFNYNTYKKQIDNIDSIKAKYDELTTLYLPIAGVFVLIAISFIILYAISRGKKRKYKNELKQIKQFLNQANTEKLAVEKQISELEKENKQLKENTNKNKDDLNAEIDKYQKNETELLQSLRSLKAENVKSEAYLKNYEAEINRLKEKLKNQPKHSQNSSSNTQAEAHAPVLLQNIDDILEKLEKLGKLKTSNTLSEEEFLMLKNQLIKPFKN